MSQDKPTIAPGVVAAVLRQYPRLGPLVAIRRNGLSANAAACLFETPEGVFFLKRYDPLLRDPAAAAREHLVAEHLQSRGFPTPRLHRNAADETFAWHLGAAYAIYDQAPGEDRYGEASVFAPFERPAEAIAAGGVLARFHHAMADAPPLPTAAPTGLRISDGLLRAPDPEAYMAGLRAESHAPGGLTSADWDALTAYATTRLARVATLLARCPRGTIHGDLIKRNLFWRGETVAAVIDFDLAIDGWWVHDLALSLLPCGFDWPRLLSGQADVNLPAMGAFLRGYEAERPLSENERAALPTMIELARLEFYLSAIAEARHRLRAEEARRFADLLRASTRWFMDHAAWHAPMAAAREASS